MEFRLDVSIPAEAVKRAVAWYLSKNESSIIYKRSDTDGHWIKFPDQITESQVAEFSQIVFDFELRLKIDKETGFLRTAIVSSALESCYGKQET